MDRITARNIAIISPMRQNFAALSKAGEFAAAIIAKYSGTESFPFTGEALVYFNALNRTLEGEKALRSSVSYTLKLLIIRRLVLDGKVADPTVTKQFLSSLSEQVERNMLWLRMTDGNAYTRLSKTIEFIDKTEDLTENIITSEITEDLRSFRYSSVDLTELEQRFFGEQSESYAYSGNHIYNMLTKLVYRKEEVHNEREVSPSAFSFGQNLSNYAETAINTDSTNYGYGNESPSVIRMVTEIESDPVVNAGDEAYSYSNEKLTYKSENADIIESTFPADPNTADDNGSISYKMDDPDIRNIQGDAESTKVAPTNDAHFSYHASETGKHETIVTEAGTGHVSTDMTMEQKPTFRETLRAGIASFFKNVWKIFRPVWNSGSESTDIEKPTNEQKSVAEARDGTYSYNTESEAEYNVANGSQEIYDTQLIIEPSGSGVHTNAEDSVIFEISETTTEAAASAADSGESLETVVNAGDENYSYTTESLTYKTENAVSENTESVWNVRNEQESSDGQDTAGNVISAPTTNITEVNSKTINETTTEAAASAADSGESLETVVNAGDENYSYTTESLTYKTENAVSENTDIQNTDGKTEIIVPASVPVTENAAINSDTSQKIPQTAERAPVTGHKTETERSEQRSTLREVLISGIYRLFRRGKSDVQSVGENISPRTMHHKTVIDLKTFIEEGDSNHSYRTDNFTSDITNENSETTENRYVLNEQNIQEPHNIPKTSGITSSVSVSDETTIISGTSEPVSESYEVNSETVVNVGNENNTYESEILTYRTEIGSSENTDIQNESSVQNFSNITIDTGEPRSDAVPAFAEASPKKTESELTKVGDLEKIGLLVMNTFLSAGSEYMSDLKKKYFHKRIELVPVTAQLNGISAQALLKSPFSSFGAITYAVRLLTDQKDRNLEEREIYENAVLTVYMGNHNTADGNIREMLTQMSPAEKTKVLSLVVNRLINRRAAGENMPMFGGEKTVADTVLDPVTTDKSNNNTAQVTASDMARSTAAEHISAAFVPEIKLLRLLSRDRYYHAVDLIGSTEDKGTIASELKKLYFGTPSRVSAESLLISRVEKAAHMPFSGASRTDKEHNDHGTVLLYRHYGGTVYYSDGNDVINNANIAQRQDTINVLGNTIHSTINLSENQEGLTGGREISHIYSMPAYAFAGNRSADNEYFTNTADTVAATSPVMRKPDSTRETVHTILERVARYDRIINKATDRINPAIIAKPVKSSAPIFFDHRKPGTGIVFDSETNTAASVLSEKTSYGGSKTDFIFDTAISGYELPIVLTPQNAVSENIRLLPVYTLDGIIIPAKSGNIALNSGINLKKNVSDHLIAARQKPMMVYRSERMRIKEKSADIFAGYEAAGAEGQTPLSMLPLMRDTSEMRYRDTEIVPAAPPREVQPQRPEMSQAELERRFGNLIEGADAGLTYSMNPTRHGIDEAIATIEETVEKVEANSKLIDEIREKQRAIESVALRATDIDRISEDTIRKLRGQLRLDRSRFS